VPFKNKGRKKKKTKGFRGFTSPLLQILQAASARSGDLNRGGEDLDAGFAWVRWVIRGGEKWWSPALAMRG
jgi:hypothetical protein